MREQERHRIKVKRKKQRRKKTNKWENETVREYNLCKERARERERQTKG
jgi:hypothetical protein